MTNITKIIRPFHSNYVNRSSVEDYIISGALFNVMPIDGQVNFDLNTTLN